MAIKKTLTVKMNDKEVQSKPFDFEAYCLVQDKLVRGYSGKCIDGNGAVIHMFKGTAVTEDYLNTLSIADRDELCKQVIDNYLEVVTEINKKHKSKNQ